MLVKKDPVFGAPHDAEKAEKDGDCQKREKAEPCQELAHHEGNDGEIDSGKP